jgi:hypothetical protein
MGWMARVVLVGSGIPTGELTKETTAMRAIAASRVVRDVSVDQENPRSAGID